MAGFIRNICSKLLHSRHFSKLPPKQHVFEFTNLCVHQPIILSSRLINTTTQAPAKKKNKKHIGSKSKDQKLQNEDRPASVDEIVNMEEVDRLFAEVLTDFHNELVSKTSIRASQASLSQLSIDIDSGKTIDLQYIAQVSVKPPNLVHISLSSHPQYIASVRKRLQRADLSLNPRVDGTSLFIEIPKVTRDHREKLSKAAKMISDQHKVKVRQVQNSNVKTINKWKDYFSIDDLRRLENKVLELGKLQNRKIDELLKSRQKELLNDQ